MNAILAFRRSKVLTLILALAAVALAFPTRVAAQSADDVTMGYIYNFARFIEWPASAFANASAPFTIGFVGRTALADALAKNVVGRKVNDRDIAIKHLEGAAGAEACQIVFIGEAAQTAAVISALKGKPVLLVGDGDEFLNAGGMIAFKKDGTRLVFDLNAPAVKAIQLVPDPKLEKAAHAVKSS